MQEDILLNRGVVPGGDSCGGLRRRHAPRSSWRRPWWCETACQTQPVHEPSEAAPVAEQANHQAAIQEASVCKATRQFATRSGQASLRQETSRQWAHQGFCERSWKASLRQAPWHGQSGATPPDWEASRPSSGCSSAPAASRQTITTASAALSSSLAPSSPARVLGLATLATLGHSRLSEPLDALRLGRSLLLRLRRRWECLLPRRCRVRGGGALRIQ